MGKCLICHKQASTISSHLGVCIDCIRQRPEETHQTTSKVHANSRKRFGLSSQPARDADGVSCGTCANKCMIGPDNHGFCGLVSNVNGHLVRSGGTSDKGILQWYYDELPTNCVNWWFCPGCTGNGYPKYAYSSVAEQGYANLAIFYGACSYDCLYCQNWHYRNLSKSQKPTYTAEEIANKVSNRVSCICYFGGDPSPQMPHCLETSHIAMERAVTKKKILRICWETNGNMIPESAKKAAEYALVSGGNIKFDLKAWSAELNLALCGVSNKPALDNFMMIGEDFFPERRKLPVLSASTLLIPGYIDTYEIKNIASFISQLDPNIPYTLLAFYPCYVMNDLPRTSQRQVVECYRSASEYLHNVRIGNIHLIQAS